MTTFNDVVNAIQSVGYNVNFQPQEKTRVKEIVCLLSDIEVSIECTTSYVFHTTVWMGWTVSDPNDVKTTLINFMQAVEPVLIDTELTFKFGKPQIEILGQLYRVSITATWKEIVEIP